MIRALTMLVLGCLGSVQAAESLEFRVFLDDKEIGYHRVELKQEGNRREVEVEARFDVKFLFLNAYSYRHQATERWQGQCLSAIDSATDDDGEQQFVRSEALAEGLRLETPGGETRLDGCVRSFAYWNAALLDAPRLLNTQTGDYEAVRRIDLGKDELQLSGQAVESQKYRLQLDGKFIDLWYSPSGEWLALRAPLEGGRVLSYYRKGVPS